MHGWTHAITVLNLRLKADYSRIYQHPIWPIIWHDAVWIIKFKLTFARNIWVIMLLQTIFYFLQIFSSREYNLWRLIDIIIVLKVKLCIKQAVPPNSLLICHVALLPNEFFLLLMECFMGVLSPRRNQAHKPTYQRWAGRGWRNADGMGRRLANWYGGICRKDWVKR